jgi:hypothetical protein
MPKNTPTTNIALRTLALHLNDPGRDSIGLLGNICRSQAFLCAEENSTDRVVNRIWRLLKFC